MGKSTQARLLVAALETRGRRALLTREPGGAPGAEALRTLLLDSQREWARTTEIYLHFAARAEHLERTILPALAEGTVVVCDRFADSTMAYQGYGLGADRALIAALTALLPARPALTLVLETSPDIAAAHLQRRDQGLDRYERMDAAFHARVRAGYRAIAAAEPDRCVVIPADGTVDEVARAIVQAVVHSVP